MEFKPGHICVYVDLVCHTDHMTMSPSQEKMTLKRVMDFVIDRGDENLREINKKLQRIVEETLTKNMHLQGVSRTCRVIYRVAVIYIQGVGVICRG